MNKSQSMGMYVILAIVVLVFISTIFMTGPSTSTSEISYTNCLQKLSNKECSKIEKYDDMIIAIPKEQPKPAKAEPKTDKNTISPFLLSAVKNGDIVFLSVFGSALAGLGCSFGMAIIISSYFSIFEHSLLLNFCKQLVYEISEVLVDGPVINIVEIKTNTTIAKITYIPID